MTGSLADRFEAIVDAYGDLDAVDDGDRTITYRELEERANRIAHWLSSLGVAPGDRVGLALWNRAEHLEVLLGAFKAGVVPVNVNCRYTANEVEALLVDADARVVVHEPTLSPTMTQASDGHDWQTGSIGAAFEAVVAAFSASRPTTAHSGDDEYILYTGGSTGTPKGVVWRQADLFTATMPAADTRRPGSRMLPASPLTHGTAQWISLSTLLSAGTVVFGPRLHLDAVALWDRIEQADVSRLVIVGDAFARPLLDALEEEPERWDLSSLVTITSGGARWSDTTIRGLLEHLPHVAMVNSFGATETGGQGSEVHFAGREGVDGRESAGGLVRFAADETTTVLDEHRQPVQPGSGTVGMLARHGPVPLGYLGDVERSAEVFPLIDGVRHAMPGDLATVDADGTIVVLGRRRNVINTGGEKVFAEEVEARLMTHPSVSEAVVVGVPHPRWGESLAALVTAVPDAEPAPDVLIDHCRSTLARFKVPRVIEVVGAIRHLPTGKLDRTWAADTMATFLTETTGA